MALPDKPVRTALCVEAHGVSWVRSAWGLSASQPRKASEPQVLFAVALFELSEVDAGPEVAGALPAPEEQPEQAAPELQEAPELGGARDAPEEQPEPVEPPEVALPPLEARVLQALWPEQA